jgi:hypothetical protein
MLHGVAGRDFKAGTDFNRVPPGADKERLRDAGLFEPSQTGK